MIETLVDVKIILSSKKSDSIDSIKKMPKNLGNSFEPP